MSDLSFIEKSRLENLFGMGDGYVLDFSNRTFEEFMHDSTGKDIYGSKYDYASGSKANRLRAFWTREPNHIVSKLIHDLLAYCGEPSADEPEASLYQECLRIAQRLRQGAPVEEIEAFSEISAGRDFEILAKAVRDAIEKNEPEVGLDRLHTFVVKYIRTLCEKHGIATQRDKPLHSLFGEYVKHLKKLGLIESEMTERILKSSISTMEAFNRVRNKQSLAHDNPMLNHSESLLIFNHVASSIRFIRELEASNDVEEEPSHVQKEIEDIPF